MSDPKNLELCRQNCFMIKVSVLAMSKLFRSTEAKSWAVTSGAEGSSRQVLHTAGIPRSEILRQGSETEPYLHIKPHSTRPKHSDRRIQPHSFLRQRRTCYAEHKQLLRPDERNRLVQHQETDGKESPEGLLRVAVFPQQERQVHLCPEIQV